MKKIASILVLFSLVSVIALPAFASSDTEFVQKSSFWHWLNDQGGIVSGIVAYGLGRTCVNSDDGYHRSSSYSGTNIFGEYVCECDYCGHKFTAYESDLKQSYQQQVVGDNGTINTVTTNNQIVNETNNTYYNPATGETKPILDWSYDYGDRTYSLGLEGNVTVDVRYGDDEITMENLHDVAGVRIICEYLSDVYKVRENLLADGFMELLREKDYIKTPKPNGYRSLHLIVAVPVLFQAGVQKVICELQLRTTAMDTWAALEHSLRYKKDRPCGPEIDCELLECADMLSETDVKMQKIAEQLNIFEN